MYPYCNVFPYNLLPLSYSLDMNWLRLLYVNVCMGKYLPSLSGRRHSHFLFTLTDPILNRVYLVWQDVPRSLGPIRPEEQSVTVKMPSCRMKMLTYGVRQPYFVSLNRRALGERRVAEGVTHGADVMWWRQGFVALLVCVYIFCIIFQTLVSSKLQQSSSIWSQCSVHCIHRVYLFPRTLQVSKLSRWR